jgi:hypothetical protein
MIHNPEQAVPAQSAWRGKAAIHAVVIFLIGVLELHPKQREFHELHHHRYGLGRGVVSQKGLGCGGYQKGH